MIQLRIAPKPHDGVNTVRIERLHPSYTLAEVTRLVDDAVERQTSVWLYREHGFGVEVTPDDCLTLTITNDQPECSA